MAHSFITDPQVDISYLAVLVAASVNMVIGAIRYSSGVFGKAWMELADMSEERVKKMKGVGMEKKYFFGSLAVLVTALFLNVFVDLTGMTSVFGGVQAGFLSMDRIYRDFGGRFRALGREALQVLCFQQCVPDPVTCGHGCYRGCVDMSSS